MREPATPDKADDSTSARPVKSPGRLAWIVWAAGAVVMTVAVVAVAIGSTGSTAPTDVVPGVNERSAALLQLDTSPQNDLVAPAFSLTDQNGAPLSLASFKGKAVVLTFNDDKCNDICTLLAQDVVAADADLGAAQNKIAFVSVNANPYYPTSRDVKLWSDQHGLEHTANWYFGTADPATLSAVANDYGVPIDLNPKDKTVAHGTEMFFISPDGHEVRVGEFGTESADTAQFGHALAQVADDLLPASERSSIAGTGATVPSAGSTQLDATPAAIELRVLGAPSTTYSTASDKGKYTLINFWASTCTACTSEMPALESEYQSLGGKVAFVGIDVADQTEAGTTFAKTFGVRYPLLEDRDGQTAGRFALSGLPYTVILGPTGKVLVRHPGALTVEQLDFLLRSLDMPLQAGQ